MASTTEHEAPPTGNGASRLAFWSGLLAAIWSIWFIVAFAPWIAGLGAWQGIDAYAARFEQLPFLA